MLAKSESGNVSGCYFKHYSVVNLCSSLVETLCPCRCFFRFRDIVATLSCLKEINFWMSIRNTAQ